MYPNNIVINTKNWENYLACPSKSSACPNVGSGASLSFNPSNIPIKSSLSYQYFLIDIISPLCPYHNVIISLLCQHQNFPIKHQDYVLITILSPSECPHQHRFPIMSFQNVPIKLKIMSLSPSCPHKLPIIRSC